MPLALRAEGAESKTRHRAIDLRGIGPLGPFLPSCVPHLNLKLGVHKEPRKAGTMHSRISENASGPIRIDHERAKRRNGENGSEQSDEQGNSRAEMPRRITSGLQIRPRLMACGADYPGPGDEAWAMSFC